MKDSKLSELRKKIDAVDSEMLSLLAKRAGFVAKVGELKHLSGEKGNFIRSGREATMIKKLVGKGAEGYSDDAIFCLWRSIISASLALENGLKIALPYNVGFEHSVNITKYFGSFSKFILCKNPDEVLEKIDSNTVGILPLTGTWWAKLSGSAYPNVKVFAKLGEGLYAAAKVTPEETGEDKTLVVSRGGTKKLGKEISTIRSFTLYETEGYKPEIKDGVVIGIYAKN